MRIIFIKDLRGQGKKGEIKEVKDGYGQNFLIKGGYAVLATDGSIQRLGVENEEKAIQDTLELSNAEDTKKVLEKINLVFYVKSQDDNHIFGSISSKQIIEELKNHKFDIDKHQIEIEETLNKIGTYFVKVILHKKVVAKVKVEIKKESR